MKLHHVGVVCDEAFQERFEELLPVLNLYLVARKEVQDFQCHCYMYGAIELVIPYGGPLLRRLQEVGTHIHHFALETDDVLTSADAMTHEGYEMVAQEPVVGVGRTLVNFVHPEKLGIMVEFVQCLK